MDWHSDSDQKTSHVHVSTSCIGTLTTPSLCQVRMLMHGGLGDDNVETEGIPEEQGASEAVTHSLKGIEAKEAPVAPRVNMAITACPPSWNAVSFLLSSDITCRHAALTSSAACLWQLRLLLP